MRYLKQSTAFTFRAGQFVDSTDGVTAETALSIGQADIQISKNGGAFAQTSATTPTTTHDVDGWYQCPLTATDTNTLGPLTVQITMAGALSVWHDFTVVPANVYDSLVDGSDALQVDTIQISGTTQTANDVGADVDAILVDTAEIGAAGVGLTAVPWNAAWDAEVQSEVTDALNAYDPPTNAEMEARTLAAAAYFDPAADTVDVGAINGSTTAAGVLQDQLDALQTGTAQAGAAGTITLAASGPVATDDYYNGQQVFIMAGTGAGQIRVITDYVGSTKVATVSPNWATNPSTDSVYLLLPSAPAAEATGSLPRVDVREWLGSAVATPTQAGVPEVDITHVGGVAEDLPTATALATVDSNVDAILVDTGTTIPATLTSMSGATFDTATDSLEALRNRGDAAWTTGAGGTPPQLLQNTTIATLASQTSFTLTAGSADDDAYNGAIIVVTDQSTSTQKAVGTISDYVGSTRTVTLSADPGIFTMAVGDTVDIIASTSSLTQADVRAAVGLASANLDTQIAALPTAAEIRAEVDSNSTQLAAILADTNELQTDNVPALIAALNDPTAAAIADAVWDELQSAHTTAGSFGEIATEIASILEDTGTTVPGLIAALNNISAADVNAQVVDVLTVDTQSLPGQGAPTATPTLAAALMYVYKAWRNKSTQTATTYTLFADDGTTTDQAATVSDDGTTLTRGEVGTGA